MENEAEVQVPPIISETNVMSAHMVDVLDMVKAGTAQIETPEDAVRVMMERLGVSEEEMQDVLEMVWGEDED